MINDPDAKDYNKATEQPKKHALTPEMEAHKWKPGQSGNPGGRPKDPGITALQMKILDAECPYDPKGRTWREYLAEKGLLLAATKEGALEHLKERLEGKVPDKHEIETGDISIIYKQVKKDE